MLVLAASFQLPASSLKVLPVAATSHQLPASSYEVPATRKLVAVLLAAGGWRLAAI
jgi:hypothetical protein